MVRQGCQNVMTVVSSASLHADKAPKRGFAVNWSARCLVVKVATNDTLAVPGIKSVS